MGRSFPFPCMKYIDAVVTRGTIPSYVTDVDTVVNRGTAKVRPNQKSVDRVQTSVAWVPGGHLSQEQVARGKGPSARS
jgi:hypothetical protein